jgi:hypothetical protein
MLKNSSIPPGASVADVVLAVLAENPTWSNDEIATKVRDLVPGAKTSGASVSSIKSRMKVTTAMTGVEAAPPTLGFSFEPEEAVELTEEQLKEIGDRLRDRYASFDRMATRLVSGEIPSLIVSGPPGLGKSHTIREKLATMPDVEHDVISGSISAVGLFIALWNMREGGVVVLDDADDAFRDETCLNILKAALDSSPRRMISWRKRAQWLEDEGIDSTFEFAGQVVFLTNVDFEAAIASGRRDSNHYAALLDRSMYLSLTIRTRRDYIVRIRQVCEGKDGMLQKDMGLTKDQANEVLDYMEDNQTRFYNLSLRLVRQVAMCLKADPENWKKDVEAVKMRTI